MGSRDFRIRHSLPAFMSWIKPYLYMSCKSCLLVKLSLPDCLENALCGCKDLQRGRKNYHS